MSPRSISTAFERDLSSGLLKPILDEVHRDQNLTIEIRRNYINVYYRGGNLLRITAKQIGYLFDFDLNYLKNSNPLQTGISALPNKVSSSGDVAKWTTAFMKIKTGMDTFFANNDKSEREFQQLVVRENNLGQSGKSSDYYICDIEYQVGNKTRFDLIAAKKTGRGRYRLALIEMKYSDRNLSGNSGIIAHTENAFHFLCNHDITALKPEMQKLVDTKRKLELMQGFSSTFTFDDEKPEFIILIANHNPNSSILLTELKKLQLQDFYTDFCKLAELKIASVSYLGYGLFDKCVYTLSEYMTINSTVLKVISQRRKIQEG